MARTVTIVYTDGACVGNPGPGGWAWVVPSSSFGSGFEANTTNQRMEITAALEALRAYDRGELGNGPLRIMSDSKYVVNCFIERWWEGWLRRGWRNSAKKPVANRDLWEPLIDMTRARENVTFEWVRAHNGDLWNERADELAVEAARRQISRRG